VVSTTTALQPRVLVVPRASPRTLGEPVEGVTSVSLDANMEQPLPGQTVKVDVHVSGAQMLTAAMVRVAYNPRS